MITNTRVKEVKNPTYFRQSKLAHKYCVGEGLEIGAGAHNPFGLPGARNVSPGDDEVFRNAEVELCGEYANIDIIAEGDDIPVAADSQDYVVSSHVFEHFPNPIAAILEWNRIVRDGGIIFLILPRQDAVPQDTRPVSYISDMEKAFIEGYTVDNWPGDIPRRSHYFVYDLANLYALVDTCNAKYGTDWALVEEEERDSKVGNGFTMVFIVHKPLVEPEVNETPDETLNQESELSTDVEDVLEDVIAVDTLDDEDFDDEDDSLELASVPFTPNHGEDLKPEPKVGRRTTKKPLDKSKVKSRKKIE